MPHFAQIDDNNIVLQVLSIDETEVNTGIWGDPSKWIQTSYNTHGGIYYIPNSDPATPDPDQSKAFRKNYAGIGFTWLPNGPDGGGFAPPSPFPSWVLNPFSYQWEPPVSKPTDTTKAYYWDEATLSWKQLGRNPAVVTPIPTTTI